jgi:hypothetical protein
MEKDNKNEINEKEEIYSEDEEKEIRERLKNLGYI